MFQSTHSLRSATMTATEVVARQKVSIHALLVECDPLPARSCTSGWGFNPRTPCGVRPMEPGGPEVLSEVSIHALLVECDRGRQSALFRVCGFNPRTPCGVRLIFQYGYKFSEWFQSTHSLWSATGHGLQWPEAVLVSIHALLVECDGPGACGAGLAGRFNPRTPCGVRLARQNQ